MKRRNQRNTHQISIRAGFVLLACGAVSFACEGKTDAEEAAEDEQHREELVQDIRNDAPESAAEMKKQVGVESMDSDRADSESELREELDLEPESE